MLLIQMGFQQVCSLLVNNLDRLDESVKEEAEGVHNTLYVISLFYNRNGIPNTVVFSACVQ